MPWSSILVTLIGAGLVAGILKYFLGGHPPAQAASEEADLQRVRIRIKGGYEPARILLKKGVPAVLEFYRDEEEACSEHVVLEAFGLNVFLPAHQSTSLRFTPEEDGVFPFSCGMGMLRGEIVVTEN